MKNTLIQYRGGESTDRAWEWNFALFDDQGRFHNLRSTGANGIKTAQETEKLLFDSAVHTFTYDLSRRKRKQSIHEFMSENVKENAIDIADLVNEVYDESMITMSCPECDLVVDPGRMKSTRCGDKKHCGPADEEFVCSSCYNAGLCPHCRNYIGPRALTLGRAELINKLGLDLKSRMAGGLNEVGDGMRYCLSCVASLRARDKVEREAA